MSHDRSQSTCSSFSYGLPVAAAAVVVVSVSDKRQLVGYGSKLLVMSERNGIFASPK